MCLWKWTAGPQSAARVEELWSRVGSHRPTRHLFLTDGNAPDQINAAVLQRIRNVIEMRAPSNRSVLEDIAELFAKRAHALVRLPPRCTVRYDDGGERFVAGTLPRDVHDTECRQDMDAMARLQRAISEALCLLWLARRTAQEKLDAARCGTAPADGFAPARVTPINACWNVIGGYALALLAGIHRDRVVRDLVGEFACGFSVFLAVFSVIVCGGVVEKHGGEAHLRHSIGDTCITAMVCVALGAVMFAYGYITLATLYHFDAKVGNFIARQQEASELRRSRAAAAEREVSAAVAAAAEREVRAVFVCAAQLPSRRPAADLVRLNSEQLRQVQPDAIFGPRPPRRASRTLYNVVRVRATLHGDTPRWLYLVHVELPGLAAGEFAAIERRLAWGEGLTMRRKAPHADESLAVAFTAATLAVPELQLMRLAAAAREASQQAPALPPPAAPNRFIAVVGRGTRSVAATTRATQDVQVHTDVTRCVTDVPPVLRYAAGVLTVAIVCEPTAADYGNPNLAAWLRGGEVAAPGGHH